MKQFKLNECVTFIGILELNHLMQGENSAEGHMNVDEGNDFG